MPSLQVLYAGLADQNRAHGPAAARSRTEWSVSASWPIDLRAGLSESVQAPGRVTELPLRGSLLEPVAPKPAEDVTI
jgi:hypothetical protein